MSSTTAKRGTGIDLVFRCASADLEMPGMVALGALRDAAVAAGVTMPATPEGGALLKPASCGLDVIVQVAIEDKELLGLHALSALAAATMDSGISALRPGSQPHSLPKLPAQKQQEAAAPEPPTTTNESYQAERKASLPKRRSSGAGGALDDNESLPPLPSSDRKGKDADIPITTYSSRSTPPAADSKTTTKPSLPPIGSKQSSSSSSAAAPSDLSSLAALKHIVDTQEGVFQYKRKGTGEGLARVFSFAQRQVSSALRDDGPTVYETADPNWAVLPGLHLLHDAVINIKKDKPYKLIKINAHSVWNPNATAFTANLIFANQQVPGVPPILPMLQRQQQHQQQAILPSPPKAPPVQHADPPQGTPNHTTEEEQTHGDGTSPTKKPKRLRTADRISRKHDRLTKDIHDLQEMHVMREKQNERLRQSAIANGVFSPNSTLGGTMTKKSMTGSRTSAKPGTAAGSKTSMANTTPGRKNETAGSSRQPGAGALVASGQHLGGATVDSSRGKQQNAFSSTMPSGSSVSRVQNAAIPHRVARNGPTLQKGGASSTMKGGENPQFNVVGVLMP